MLLYYLVIAPLSRLPFMVLYRISDLLFLVMYHVFPYRKDVVMHNLRNSFPEKNEDELIMISKKFFRHFCDLIIESVKTFSISEKEVKKRIVCLNPEVANRHFAVGRSIVMIGGHYNNWELFAVGIDSQINHDCVGIYKPLSDKFMDKIMKKTRQQFGLQMLPTKEVKDFFAREKKRLTCTIFALDQSPSNIHQCHWMKFLNQDTAVVFGAEKYAREYNYPVVFGHLEKVKRGHYTFEMTEITADPGQMKPAEITEKATQLLERAIMNKPEFWLWTHKRWKHKRPDAMMNK